MPLCGWSKMQWWS